MGFPGYLLVEIAKLCALTGFFVSYSFIHAPVSPTVS